MRCITQAAFYVYLSLDTLILLVTGNIGTCIVWYVCLYDNNDQQCMCVSIMCVCVSVKCNSNINLPIQ